MGPCLSKASRDEPLLAAGLAPPSRSPSPPAATERGWRTLKCFLSSTFIDCRSERSHLTSVVLPEINAFCSRRRLLFLPIDLRWGVSVEDSAEAGRVVEICLGEIERSDVVVAFVGHRYGWIPGAADIPPCYSESWIAGKSVTEMEIIAASRRVPAIRLISLVRDVATPRDEIPPEAKAILFDEDPTSIDALRQDLIDNHGATRYATRFSELADDNSIVLSGMEQFGTKLQGLLEEALDDLFPLVVAPTDPLAAESEYHDVFAETRTLAFVGRARLVEQILEYVGSDSDSAQPLAIFGSAGTGKSALLAFAARQARQQGVATRVVLHFVGASPASVDVDKMLLRLAQQVFALSGKPRSEIPALAEADFEQLATGFADACQAFAETRPGQRLLIVIDALNQLTDEPHRAHSLHWLPTELPRNVRIVCSCLEGTSQGMLRVRGGPAYDVGLLEEQECREIVVSRLKKFSKTLSSAQLTVLLGKQEATKPLFLIVACEELRAHGVFETLDTKVERLPGTVADLFADVFERMETEFGGDLVAQMLGLVELSRGGLLEYELRRLLDDRNALELSRVLRALAPYLKATGESGEGFVDFFHRQVSKSVRDRYLQGSTDFALETHAKLAAFFRTAADPDSDRRWKGRNPRPFAHVFAHTTLAKDWAAVGALAGDLLFIEAVAAHGLISQHVRDLGVALASCPEDAPARDTIADARHFVRRTAHFLGVIPGDTFQKAINEPNASRIYQAAQRRVEDAGEGLPVWLEQRNKDSTLDPRELTFTGHIGQINMIAYAPDGKLMVSGSLDRTLRIWDLGSGELVQTLRGHGGWMIKDCVFSPNGKFVVSISDRELCVWNHTLGVVQSRMPARGAFNVMALSHDGARVALAESDNSVTVYDLSSQEAQSQHQFTSTVRSIVFSTDDDMLATACEGGEVAVHRLPDWDEVLLLEGHGWARSIRFSKDDSTIYFAAGQGLVSIVDLAVGEVSGSMQTSARGHQLRSIALSPDERYLVAGQSSGDVSVFDVEERREVQRLKAHFEPAITCDFDPVSGRTFASAGKAGIIKVFSLALALARGRPEGHSGSVWSTSFNKAQPDADQCAVVSGSADGTVIVWNADLQPAHVLTGHNQRVDDVRWLAGGDGRVVSGGHDGLVIVWDSATGAEQKRIDTECNDKILAMAAHTADPKLAATGLHGGEVDLWDLESGAKIRRIGHHIDRVDDMEFSPGDGNLLATGGWDRRLRIFDTRAEREVQELTHHKLWVRSVSFSPDGRLLASGSNDSYLKIVDVRTWKVVWERLEHHEAVRCLEWRGDKSLVSASRDRSIKIWDMDAKFASATLWFEESPCCVDALGDDIVVSFDSGALQRLTVHPARGTLHHYAPRHEPNTDHHIFLSDSGAFRGV